MLWFSQKCQDPFLGIEPTAWGTLTLCVSDSKGQEGGKKSGQPGMNWPVIKEASIKRPGLQQSLALQPVSSPHSKGSLQ